MKWTTLELGSPRYCVQKIRSKYLATFRLSPDKQIYRHTYPQIKEASGSTPWLPNQDLSLSGKPQCGNKSYVSYSLLKRYYSCLTVTANVGFLSLRVQLDCGDFTFTLFSLAGFTVIKAKDEIPESNRKPLIILASIFCAGLLILFAIYSSSPNVSE